MRCHPLFVVAVFASIPSTGWAQPISGSWTSPNRDRLMYPFADNAGGRALSPIFSTLAEAGPDGRFDDRDAQFLVSYDTGAQVVAGLPPAFYHITRVRLTAMNQSDGLFPYDRTVDPVGSYFIASRPGVVADADAGRPIELFAVAYRAPFTATTYAEFSPFKPGSSFTPPWIDVRYAYPIGFDTAGAALDASNTIKSGTELAPIAIGQAVGVREGQSLPNPGDLVSEGTDFAFEVDLSNPSTLAYIQSSLASGRLNLLVTALHLAPEFGNGAVSYPVFYNREAPILGFPDALPARLLIEGVLCTADYNRDGFLNQEDLSGFITSFLAEPAEPGVANFGYSRTCAGNAAPYQLGFDADYNLDCEFNQEDLSGYITAYFEGCGE